MSEKKHTPGPWFCGPDSAFLEPPRATFDVAYTREAMSGFTMTERREAYEANARLIAAAPDMLEALEVALAYLVMAGTDHAEPTRATIRAAIKKARGES